MTTPLKPRQRAGQPFVIGLTGNIACGKSTVVTALEEMGAVGIDADAVYHDLIAPNAPLWHTLRDRHGPVILNADGTINRRWLAQQVFPNPEALAELEQLTHPAVVAAIRDRVASTGPGIIVVDAVKLVESGLDTVCDQLWVVVCEPEQQAERLMRRNRLRRDEAEQRVAAQPVIGPKLEKADVIIDNSGTLAETRQQVEQAWRRLRCDRAT